MAELQRLLANPQCVTSDKFGTSLDCGNSGCIQCLCARLRHGIGELTLALHQRVPVDPDISHQASAAEPRRVVKRLGCADQHLLWIAAAQDARAAEWTVIDHRDTP